MPSERVDERVLVKYLLGDLSEAEQVQVEDRAFADSEYLGALEAVEADLIDAWVRGELPQSERRAFERRFLISPRRRSKVEFARDLARVATEWKAAEAAPAPALSGWQSLVNLLQGLNPAVRFAASVAALLCVVGATWLLIENTSMRSRVRVLETQRRELELRDQNLQRQLSDEQRRAGSLDAQLQQQTSAAGRPASVIASLILVPGLSRSETRVQQMVLGASAQIAHIEIQLESRDDYARFRAELRTRSGEDVLTRGSLPRRRTAAGFAVSFDLPASALAAGEYELALKGIASNQSTKDIGYYYFSVQKR